MNQKQWNKARARLQIGDEVLLVYSGNAAGYQYLRAPLTKINGNGLSIGKDEINFEHVVALSLILYEEKVK